MEKAKKLIDRTLKVVPGGIFGLISVSISFVCICFSITQFPDYDMMRNDISVLGIGPRLAAPVFNIGLILTGIFTIPFFIYLGRILQQENMNKNLSKKAIKLSILGCLSLSFIGCFPVINLIMGIIHALLALIFFVSGLISLTIFSILIIKDSKFSKIHGYFGFIIAGIISFYLITRWSIIEWLLFFAIAFWIIDVSIYTLYTKIKI